MKVSLQRIIEDYLASRGESPDLLPILEEGEESAVLTLSRQLKVSLLPAAIKATLEAPTLHFDELRQANVTPLVDTGGLLVLRMPDDYLRLYSLRMGDWKEPVRKVEPEGSLRYVLGANAPEWMICSERPMVTEKRDATGITLRVYGSQSMSAPPELLYVPLPTFDGETLTLQRSVYEGFLKSLSR